MKILINDEQLNGKITNQFEIEVTEAKISTEDLIKTRVAFEVEAYNEKLPEYFSGLIAPTDAERTLNGLKLKKRQVIDVEKQIFIALDAFQKNGFFILVDNQQLEQLDQQVDLRSDSTISFVKLTPLVGG